MATLDPDDPRPPYQQIAAVLRGEIESGALPKGAQVPSYSALSEEYGVSIGTARSAVAALQSEGLIVTRHGKGSFVRTKADDPPSPSADDLDSLRQGLADLADRVAAIEQKLTE